MLTLADNDIAEAVRDRLRVIRAKDDGDPDAMDGLRRLLVEISPTGGTGMMPTALHAPAERSAAHLAINKLVVAIEEGARGATIDGLWEAALEAAHAWVRTARRMN